VPENKQVVYFDYKEKQYTGTGNKSFVMQYIRVLSDSFHAKVASFLGEIACAKLV